jgi:hypothetical protein
MFISGAKRECEREGLDGVSQLIKSLKKKSERK